jgi:L-aminopeptidase/D-esterase-like protein
MIPEGFSIGHWTDGPARTGCMVILCPPGTRETALLENGKKMEEA